MDDRGQYSDSKSAFKFTSADFDRLSGFSLVNLSRCSSLSMLLNTANLCFYLTVDLQENYISSEHEQTNLLQKLLQTTPAVFAKIMDILKPEVYWIGNRCYRVNPCQGQNNHLSQDFAVDSDDNSNKTATSISRPGGAVKPYVEPDEFEDALDTDDMSTTGNEIELIKDKNGFKVICSIPSSLFSHIIGFKGTVRNRIENETRTRIYVPRLNEKGDIEIQGQIDANVRKCFTRLNDIALSARFRREATHFACFSMNETCVIQKAKEFKEMVLAKCGTNSRGIDGTIFQVPEKLHLTISVLVLLDERERQSAANILSSLDVEIKQLTGGKPLKIHLTGLEIMNDDPTQVDILYAKCEPVDNDPTIQKIANLIAKKFEEKLLAKQTKGEQVKLHCTVINSRYRSESASDAAAQPENRKQDSNNRRKNNSYYNERQSFDARSILENYGKFDFGVVQVSEIKIATRHTTGTHGFYKCYSSLKI